MTLPPAQIFQAEERRQQWPFVWLLEIPIPDPITPTVARLTNHSEAVNFLQTSEGDDLVWTSWRFTLEALRQDTKGTQQTVSIVLSNGNRELIALVDEYDGLENVHIRYRLVNLGTLTDGVAYIDERGRVLSAGATNDVVTFEVGTIDVTRSKLPANRVTQDFCGFTYKGARCGYTGGLVSCAKTLNGPNGCVEHANEDRFGAFPGVPVP